MLLQKSRVVTLKMIADFHLLDSRCCQIVQSNARYLVLPDIQYIPSQHHHSYAAFDCSQNTYVSNSAVIACTLGLNCVKRNFSYFGHFFPKINIIGTVLSIEAPGRQD
jgi:hypothetical protein